MATSVSGLRSARDRGAPPAAAPRPRTAAGLRRRAPSLVLALPVVTVLIGAWVHRWVNEDAFINFRVVDQLLAGNGPVFNHGERVEAVTSPLWLAVLLLGRLTLGQVLRMEWVAVVTGLAATCAAFVVGCAGARTLHGRHRTVLPLGLLMLAALPVAWDYATAGLEISLAWLWLGTCWFVLLRTTGPTGPPGGTVRVASLVLLGLGPLIRP